MLAIVQQEVARASLSNADNVYGQRSRSDKNHDGWGDESSDSGWGITPVSGMKRIACLQKEVLYIFAPAPIRKCLPSRRSS